MATATAVATPSTPRQLSGDPTTAPSPNQAQTLSDYDLVQYVTTLVQRSRDHRRNVAARWTRNYEILHNRVMPKHPYMPVTDIPEIFPIYRAMIGWMTDTRPQFNIQSLGVPFSPYAETFSKMGEDLKVAMNAAWTMHDYDAAVERVCGDALTYGISWFKTVWNGTLLGGIGNPQLLRVDPFTFFPDPLAHSLEDAEYLCEVSRVSLQTLDRRFPGAAKKVAQEASFTQPDDQAPTRASIQAPSLPRANPGAISPATSTRYGMPGQGQTAAADHQGVTLIEAWLREHTHTKHDDGSTTTVEDWRWVVIAGQTVIKNTLASTFTESRRHPYERYVLLDEGEMYGQSLVELLAPLQVALNRLWQHTEHHVWLVGNPPFIESTRSGMSRQQITNRAGQRLRKNDGAEAGWLDPPKLDPNLVPQLIGFILGRLESASGLSAINGKMPGGRNAQGVIDSVAEASFVGIRLSQRELERVLSRCGELVASYITEYYDEPRILATVGPDEAPQTRVFKALHFYSPQEAGEDRSPMRFHLQVDAGSSLPTSRSARAAEADTLFAMGAIDTQAVLEAHKWPGRDAIAKRVAYQNATGISNQPSARTAGRA